MKFSCASYDAEAAIFLSILQENCIINITYRLYDVYSRLDLTVLHKWCIVLICILGALTFLFLLCLLLGFNVSALNKNISHLLPPKLQNLTIDLIQYSMK